MCLEIAEASGQAPPRLSVIVRSYNRLGALAELLAALLAQDHDSFEIVVVEQSTVRPPEDLSAVEKLALDPRIRMLRFSPLGGPGARNAGVRASRGDLLVFIDDDDLPAGTDWLRRHEANFTDPKCLGVTGRFLAQEGGVRLPPYANADRARRKVLSFNALKWQRVYAGNDQKKHVQSLMGGNAAIPRRTLERFGLWDECTPIEDEPSLAYRINAGKADDEYLLFDPDVPMIRRLDVPGGMAKRTMSGPRYGKRVFTFLHNIIGHYFPVRFIALYPVYVAFALYLCVDWIHSDSKNNRTLLRRLAASAAITIAIVPLWIAWLAQWTAHRLVKGAPAHRPSLAPRDVRPGGRGDRGGSSVTVAPKALRTTSCLLMCLACSTAASAEPRVDLHLGAGELFVSRFVGGIDTTVSYSNVVIDAHASFTWWGTAIGARIAAGGLLAVQQASLPAGSPAEQPHPVHADVDVAFRRDRSRLSFAAGPSLIYYDWGYLVGIAAEARMEWQVEGNFVGVEIGAARSEFALSERSIEYLTVTAGLVVGFH